MIRTFIVSEGTGAGGGSSGYDRVKTCGSIARDGPTRKACTVGHCTRAAMGRLTHAICSEMIRTFIVSEGTGAGGGSSGYDRVKTCGSIARDGPTRKTCTVGHHTRAAMGLLIRAICSEMIGTFVVSEGTGAGGGSSGHDRVGGTGSIARDGPTRKTCTVGHHTRAAMGRLTRTVCSEMIRTFVVSEGTGAGAATSGAGARSWNVTAKMVPVTDWIEPIRHFLVVSSGIQIPILSALIWTIAERKETTILVRHGVVEGARDGEESAFVGSGLNACCPTRH